MACRLGCSDLQGFPVFKNLGGDGFGVVFIEDEDLLIPP